MSCLEERTGLLCSRLTVQGPVQLHGASSWGSRVQSHLPCVVRGLGVRPDGVDCEVSHPFSSESCLPGQGVCKQPHQKQALLAPIPAHILPLLEVPTVAPAR